MLDYGAAVAIKFASSKSAVKGLTPAEYGTFLRNDPEYGLLIDNASCAPAERAKVRSTAYSYSAKGRYNHTSQFVVKATFAIFCLGRSNTPSFIFELLLIGLKKIEPHLSAAPPAAR